MLEIVEKQHELAVAEKRTKVVGCADRLRDLARDETRVSERAEWNPEDAVRDRADELSRDLKRQSSLARSTRPGDRDEPPTFESVDELLEVPLAPEKRACRDREVRLVER